MAASPVIPKYSSEAPNPFGRGQRFSELVDGRRAFLGIAQKEATPSGRSRATTVHSPAEAGSEDLDALAELPKDLRQEARRQIVARNREKVLPREPKR